MRIESPQPKPIAEGDYYVHVTKGYGDPDAEIWLDEKGELRLNYVSLEDCDRLIKAACEAKEKIARYRAELATPHGRKHLYQGRCQLCGKPEDDELHAEPVITCSERTCDAKHPETGDWCVLEGPHAQHSDTYGQTWPNHGYAATSEAEASALLAESIATGTPVLVTEDEPALCGAWCEPGPNGERWSCTERQDVVHGPEHVSRDGNGVEVYRWSVFASVTA
jgi:hypothetical protein